MQSLGYVAAVAVLLQEAAAGDDKGHGRNTNFLKAEPVDRDTARGGQDSRGTREQAHRIPPLGTLPVVAAHPCGTHVFSLLMLPFSDDPRLGSP